MDKLKIITICIATFIALILLLRACSPNEMDTAERMTDFGNQSLTGVTPITLTPQMQPHYYEYEAPPQEASLANNKKCAFDYEKGIGPYKVGNYKK